jgi:threonyl-tRNA synthetase
MENTTNLEKMRHSGAHLMAHAVTTLYPNVKLAIGPAINSGFYYDFDFGEIQISEHDLKKIEKKMNELQKKDYKFEKIEMDIKEAEVFLTQSNQPYSLSLLEDIKEKGSTKKEEFNTKKKKVSTVTFYKSGDFINLCKGGHVNSYKDIGAYKLISIAGAYFRGNEKNKMLTRIYAACFETQNKLDIFLKEKENAKGRDHRIIGERLNLFMISEEVGQGLPLLLPKGETLKHLLMQYMRKKEEKLGFKYVSTPHLANEKLYQQSGHVKFYSNDMYKIKDKEGSIFYIKPMNCPHHHMIYKKMIQSYKQLPLKLSESAGLYRYERSGTLTGLIRVRGPITQNDSHIYISKEQLSEEFRNLLDLFKNVYKDLNIKDYWFRISLPDFKKDKYEGDKNLWEYTADNIESMLKEQKLSFTKEIGDAAFYGPKLDIQIKNLQGNEDTIATIQVDILVPQRMGLFFINSKGNKEIPIVIHKSILGSYERFMAFFIEQTNGNFPIKFSPIQVKIIPVSEQFNKSSIEIETVLKDNEIRVEIDTTDESVGKKIRNATIEQIPAKIVIGQKEVDFMKKNKTWDFNINWRPDIENKDHLNINEFIALMNSEKI